MEKRFVLFMVLSVAIMATYIGLQAYFAPPKPPQQVAKKDDGKQAKPPAPKNDDKEKADPAAPPVPPAEAPDVEATSAPQKWLSLGSVDPNSPYRLLATFNSRGGSIERIELASPRYRDLHDRSGYLGHLALGEAGGKGCEVRVVGAGTPAAMAGMAVGDIIEAIGNEPTSNTSLFERVLGATRPGQRVEVRVQRQGEAAPLVLAVDLIRRPLEVIRPEIEQPPPRGSVAESHPPSMLTTLIGNPILSTHQPPARDPLRNAHWEAKAARHGEHEAVEFSYRLNAEQAKEYELAGPVEVIKRYWIEPIASETDRQLASYPAYHVNYELEIRNLGNKALEVAYRQDGPNGLPLEGWWYTSKIGPGWGAAGARDIVWRKHNVKRALKTCSEIFTPARKNPDDAAAQRQSLLGTDDSERLDYVGVDAQYFSAVLLPELVEGVVEPVTYRQAFAMPVSSVANIPKVEFKRTNVTFQLTSEVKRLPPEGSYKQTMRLFAGPKVPELMAEYDIDDIIEYGWFRAVSIPLSKLLHFLKHNIFFNYGLAIIALTVIVRGCMLPFSLKAARNAALMQEMQPELKKVMEKYKNDLPKRTEAQQELYRKYKFNPLSGCLPMFLQLPIFLGLYRSLSVDIELRQAALIPGVEWASNLAGPDMLFNWGRWLWMPNFIVGEAAGWLGPYFNLLPIISVVLLQIHQRMFTPPATDEQMKMTQDMMKYMTVFMGFLFFKVPAGLCIYFITSSGWSIVERQWMPKKQLAATGREGDSGGKPVAPASPSGNGASGRVRAAKKQKRR